MTNYGEVYNKIEKLALENGYSVNRFTRDFPTFKELEMNFREPITEPVHYIHVIDGETIILSVFYDEKCAVNMFFGEPNYEIYDRSDVLRFSATEEDIKALLNVADKIIKEQYI